MKIEAGSRLVMIGDSITDAGRARPIGEGRGEALGKGYVALVDSLLGTWYPEHGIRVTNVGTSGNTVRNLQERWQTDVIDLQPDWLSVMIGINDVWRQFDLPTYKERHVHIEEYERTLRELVDTVRGKLKGLVLMTPFYIEPNQADAMRVTMDAYGRIVEQIASETGAVFVDTQRAFDRVLEHYYPATLAWDRVHPGMTGHMVLARAFLDGIGFEWNRS